MVYWRKYYVSAEFEKKNVSTLSHEGRQCLAELATCPRSIQHPILGVYHLPTEHDAASGEQKQQVARAGMSVRVGA